MQRYITIYQIFCIGIVLCGGSLAGATITIDPNSTGAADVWSGSSSNVVLLTNPVVDPLVTNLMRIGRSGVGALSVTSGSQVDSNQTWIGVDLGSQGSLLLDGTGTQWSGGADFRVGMRGQGIVEVTGSANLQTGQGWIGSGSGTAMSNGTVHVSGAGSRWDSSQIFFRVGDIYSGTEGSLYISDGGAVEINTAGGTVTADSQFAKNIYRTGTVSVDGAGSTLKKTGAMLVTLGTVWQNSLSVSNGGLVEVVGDLIVEESSGATSQVSLNSGTIDAHGLWFDPNRFTGSGTANITGAVVDSNLTFNSTQGPQQQWTFNSHPGQNVVVNLDHTRPGPLGVGHDGVGTMTISEGRQLVTDGQAMLGNNVGSMGTATVDGIGTKWQINDNLDVGNRGVGRLLIENSAVVEVASEVLVTRESSAVGSEIHFGNGTLDAGSLFASRHDLTGTGTINALGLVTDIDLVFDQTSGTTQQIVLNSDPNQNVTVNLQLSSSQPLGAGYRGSSTLHIADAQQIASTDAYLGFGTGGQGDATVTGSGSAWNISRGLKIGSLNSGATGQLIVEAGAKVVVSDEVELVNTSMLEVSDPNSILRSDSFFASFGASLEVNSGGAVETPTLLVDSSAVQIQGIGSRLLTSNVELFNSTLTIDSGGNLEIAFGRLRVESGSTLNLLGGVLDMGGGDIDLSSQLVFSGGTLKNVGEFSGDLTQTGGVLELRADQVPTEISGDYSLSGGGTLKLNLNGAEPFDPPIFDVDGSITLDSAKLDVSLGDPGDPNYVPPANAYFNLFTNSLDTLSGEFDEVTLPELPAELRWNLFYETNPSQPNILLGVVPAIAADFNADGVVDLADRSVWQSTYGNSQLHPFQSGDANGDGRSDGLDFLIWQQQFGMSVSSLVATVNTVPEPSGSALILMALVFYSRRRARRDAVKRV